MNTYNTPLALPWASAFGPLARRGSRTSTHTAVRTWLGSDLNFSGACDAALAVAADVAARFADKDADIEPNAPAFPADAGARPADGDIEAPSTWAEASAGAAGAAVRDCKDGVTKAGFKALRGANGSCSMSCGRSVGAIQGKESSGKRQPMGESPGIKYRRSSRTNQRPLSHCGALAPAAGVCAGSAS